jgi:hypothetical protein
MRTLEFILVPILLLSSSAFAEQARILKVKGQQAIVQFPSGVKPQVGELINVGNDVNLDDSSGGAGSRQYLLGLSTSLTFKNNSQTSKSNTHFDVSGRFGWNLIQMEAGPIASLAYDSGDLSSSTAVLVGGFFDYNLVPNKPGVEMVYGIGGEASIGQSSNSVSSISTSIVDIFLGGFIKYWALKNSVAFRGDGGYDYYRTAQSNSSTATSISGFVIKGGLSVYF